MKTPFFVETKQLESCNLKGNYKLLLYTWANESVHYCNGWKLFVSFDNKALSATHVESHRKVGIGWVIEKLVNDFLSRIQYLCVDCYKTYCEFLLQKW